jgi:hypothetical protein
MYSTSSLPPDLAAFFNRFLNEELHQIGMAFIEQSQHHVDKQLQSRPTSSPQIQGTCFLLLIFILQFSSNGIRSIFSWAY